MPRNTTVNTPSNETTAVENPWTGGFDWSTTNSPFIQPIYFGSGVATEAPVAPRPGYQMYYGEEPRMVPTPLPPRNRYRGENEVPRHRFRVGQVVKLNTADYGPDLNIGDSVLIEELIGVATYSVRVMSGRHSGITLDFREEQLKNPIKRNLPEWW